MSKKTNKAFQQALLGRGMPYRIQNVYFRRNKMANIRKVQFFVFENLSIVPFQTKYLDAKMVLQKIYRGV